MILEIISYTGPALLVGPVTYITYRAFQFRNTISRGKVMHTFKPHIRRDVYGPHTMNWCDVCKLRKKAWIHYPEHDKDDDHPVSTGARIRQLEQAEIKWRFENDPEWVKVFGEEYDPKTFEEIPKFHNGECGGPHDSCERCAWEADQAQLAKEKDRTAHDKSYYDNKRNTQEKANALLAAELKGYREILWDLWESTLDKDEVKEEWDELLDEIGMLKNDELRRKIKDLEVFKRLNYLMYDHEERKWNRREEVWQAKVKRDRSNRYDYY